jgi:hypothetical protein
MIGRGSFSAALPSAETELGWRNDLLCFCGYAAFHQARDVSENSAAIYPVARIDGPYERCLGNSWWLGASYPPDAPSRCMGPRSPVGRSVSREHIHGDEPVRGRRGFDRTCG